MELAMHAIIAHPSQMLASWTAIMMGLAMHVTIALVPSSVRELMWIVTAVLATPTETVFLKAT
jgi:hypothetical protein